VFVLQAHRCHEILLRGPQARRAQLATPYCSRNRPDRAYGRGDPICLHNLCGREDWSSSGWCILSYASRCISAMSPAESAPRRLRSKPSAAARVYEYGAERASPRSSYGRAWKLAFFIAKRKMRVVWCLLRAQVPRIVAVKGYCCFTLALPKAKLQFKKVRRR
jgi:hypothetical protein